MRFRPSPFPAVALLTVTVLAFAGCSSSSSTDSPEKISPTSGSTSSPPAVAVAHPDGDPSVSAEDGGPGFTGEGWKTASPGPLGDPNAVPGGFIKTSIPNWPDNLRVYGTGANTYINSIVESLAYESLLSQHPETLEFIPALASHWWVSEDNMTFRFRINPKAHWSDGQPVTADDVVETYRLIMDETLLDPMNVLVLGVMNEPVAKSKYLLEVTCKHKHWRNMLTFSAMKVLPAHEIRALDKVVDKDGKSNRGKNYLDQYAFKYTAVSGPYEVLPEDIRENDSLTLTRRTNYWGDSTEANKGLYNFKKIRFSVIRDHRLAFEQACKGELDFYPVYTAKWWVKDLENLDAVKKNHLIRRKVFNKAPQGVQGLALNMRKGPLADLSVRKALAHLYDRRKMVEMFAYNEYDMLFSYFPNSEMENPNNERIEFDPSKGIELLRSAGWTEVGSDGIRLKDGVRLSFTCQYQQKEMEKYFTHYKEDLKRAGVELNLTLMTPETLWQNMMDQKFEISSMAWTSVLFPDPSPNWNSKMASSVGSNNITGFAMPEADALMKQYDESFDLAKRQELLRELDGMLHAQHPYVLSWFLPCERLIYWDKFGTPKGVLGKYEDWRGVFSGWWQDPAKSKALEAAKKSGEPLKPIPLEERFWDAPAQQAAAE